MYCGDSPGCDEGGEKADRVSVWLSYVVGAAEGGGGGDEELKPVISQRTMQPSRSAFERTRSWWNATLVMR
jgi:hypothetical protein